MKSGLTKLRGHLLEQTNRAREALAREKLNIEAIRLMLDGAAQQGDDAVRIRVDVDIRQTTAAAALNQWAAKEGLILTWEMRPVDQPDGRRVSTFDPEIRWLLSGLR